MKRIALVLLAALSLCVSAPAQTPLFHQYEHVLGTIAPMPLGTGDVDNVAVPKFDTTGKTLQYVEFTTDTLHYKYSFVSNRSCTTAKTVWFGDNAGASGDAACVSSLTYQVPSGSWLYGSYATYALDSKTLAIAGQGGATQYWDTSVLLSGIATRMTNPGKWAGMAGTSGTWNLQLTHSYSGGYGEGSSGTSYGGTGNSFGFPTAYTGGCQETRSVDDYDVIDWDVYVNYTYTVP